MTQHEQSELSSLAEKLSPTHVPEPSPPDRPKRRGPVRWLYDWVLHWADTPYGTPALAAIAFAESSFFPIPPDVLQMALSVSKPKRSFYYATVAAIFSVLGAFLGYYIGYALWGSMGDWFLTYIPGLDQQIIDTVMQRYADHAFLAILGAAFTPIPYKVFTIAAGISDAVGGTHALLWTLFFASAMGRSARFFIVATCVYLFGPRVKDLIDRYFGLVTLALFVLIVVGVLAAKYLLH